MLLNTEEILQGLKEKRPDAFERLYTAYAPMIMGHVRKNSGSEEDGRELVQLTMVKLWMAVKEGRYAEAGKFDQYVFQIAANSWREELRRRRNRPASAVEEEAFSLPDEREEDLVRLVVKDRYLDAVHQGLQQMGGICQDLIQMYHLQKIDLLQIAERLSYDYNNLRKRIFDCRKKLKTIVEHIIKTSS